MLFKRKELLIILILAGLVAVLSGYFFDFPLRVTEPAVCIQMLDSTCYPFKILWANALLDLLFWFVGLAAGWWGIRKLKIKNKK